MENIALPLHNVLHKRVGYAGEVTSQLAEHLKLGAESSTFLSDPEVQFESHTLLLSLYPFTQLFHLLSLY
jgi:hypothetical protein